MNASLSWFVLPVWAVLVAYALTWVARLVAPRLRFVDCPDGQRKRHKRPTPLLGGAAIYLTFNAIVLLSVAAGITVFTADQALGPLLLSGALFCGLGLWDDRWPLGARDKFLLQLLASLPFAAWGPTVDSVAFLGLSCELGSLAIPFTVLWLVSCANVINLIDGLDGLATVVGIVATITLGVLSLLSERYGVAATAFIFVGSQLGFLLHNWPPAKIFLGDAGSLFIGFVVGAISIEASVKTAAGFTLALPLVVLSIPILDTCLAILRRKLTGRGIGHADRGHIHHRLQDRGLTKLQTLLAIGTLSTTFAVAAIGSSLIGSDGVAIMLASLVLGVLLFGRVLGFHEMLLVIYHIRFVQSILTSTFGSLGSRVLLVRLQNASADELDELWEAVRRRVARMGGDELSVEIRRFGNGPILDQRTWSAPEQLAHGPAWEFRYTVAGAHREIISMSSKGRLEQGSVQRLDDLFRLMEAFCQCWRTLSQSRETVLTMEPPRPLELHARDEEGAGKRRAA